MVNLFMQAVCLPGGKSDSGCKEPLRHCEGDILTVLKDEQIMLLAAEGDLDAFNEIVLRHQRTAWSVAYRFIGDSAEAEDITQEAFLRVLETGHQYRPSAAFSTYLYRIITRLCIDHTRKKRPSFTGEPPEIADRSHEPSATLYSKERETKLRQAMDSLSPRQRMAIILKYYEELSYADIAKALETTVKAVERLLDRARKTLKAGLLHIRK